MTLLGGVSGAGLTGVLTLLLLGPTTSNLDPFQRAVTLVVTTLIVVLIGFLTGSAVFRRAGARSGNLSLFAGLAGGFGCGLVGAVWVLALLTAYFVTYSGWPPGRLDEILTVIAFPVLGAFGFTIGALAGGISGLVAGGLLGLLLPARRY